MADLIACLGQGSASQTYIEGLINGEGWDHCIIISGEQAKLNTNKPAEIVVIDTKKPLPELASELKDVLFKKLGEPEFGCEIGLNIATGSGKEHMAVLSAVIKMGFGIRLVALTNAGNREI